MRFKRKKAERGFTPRLQQVVEIGTGIQSLALLALTLNLARIGKDLKAVAVGVCDMMPPGQLRSGRKRRTRTPQSPDAIWVTSGKPNGEEELSIHADVQRL